MSAPQTVIYLLHQADIAAHSRLARVAQGWLNDAERERQHRFKNPRAQHTYLLSRALLRGCLSGHCSRPPEQLQFAYGKAGKPYLCQTQSDIAFNLSHSGQWLALAVSQQGAVGVDIEQPEKPRDVIKIARHYFHRSEYRALANLPAKAQEREFYRLWTLKEAFFKARGTGISEGLENIRFNDGKTPIKAIISPQLMSPEQRWQFYYWYNPEQLQPPCHLALTSQGANTTVPVVTRVTQNDLLNSVHRTP